MNKTTLCLLTALSCFCVTTFADEEPAPQQPKIRLAVYGDNGAGGWKRFPPLVENDPTIEMEVLNGQQIRDGALDKFDLIILPGGSGKGQGASMGPEGVEKVKQFVASGKGFIGICAGAYFPIQQDFLNAQTKDPRWQRGITHLKIEFSELGLKTFGDKYKGLQEILYGDEHKRLPRPPQGRSVSVVQNGNRKERNAGGNSDQFPRHALDNLRQGNDAHSQPASGTDAGTARLDDGDDSLYRPKEQRRLRGEVIAGTTGGLFPLVNSPKTCQRASRPFAYDGTEKKWSENI